MPRRDGRPESKFVSIKPIVGTNLGALSSLRSSGINGPKGRRFRPDAYVLPRCQGSNCRTRPCGGLMYNNVLQWIFDPLSTFSAAKAGIASNAAEHSVMCVNDQPTRPADN